MSAKQNAKFQELVTKLREIFQIDRPDLDFGIYRILNARADEINDYLEKRLPEKVQAALNSGNEAQREHAAKELKEKEEQYAADGLNPDTVPKVQELRQKLAEYSAGASEHENAVFSHLLTFFSRYYDNGDFISQRRYKGDTYAIPYAGEEVMLHWANKDQYYTKSGENFANYSFKLQDGRTVHFRLVSADTAKDNRKDNDKERRFTLIQHKTVTRIDEQGDEYDEILPPVEEVDGTNGKELIIRFEYALQPKGTKQGVLVSQAVNVILADEAVKTRWLDLENRAPTEKNPQRTLLVKHLVDYTTKNTADYFIHKDLGGFLRRELDFYIKNEVMHLDDVQNADAFANIEKNLRMIQCLRAISLEVVDFLAQLENFQKKLWLKKKFVVSSHYCITLDRVPAELYPEIVANERQWEQWRQLGVWNGVTHGTVEDLEAGSFRMVDTSLFAESFRHALLNLISELESGINGVLIHGDNFQALSILGERYKSNIDSVYIDPPYNTDGSPIAYKNGYKKSSWNALIDTRLRRTVPLMSENGLLCATIDDFQKEDLTFVMQDVFGVDGIAGTVAIRSNPSGRPVPSGFAQSHEYAIYAHKSATAKIGTLPRSEAQLQRYREEDSNGRYMWELFRKRGSASLRSDRRTMYYPLYFNGSEVRVPEMEWNEDEKDWILTENPSIHEEILWPIDEQGLQRRWRWSPTRVKKDYSQFKVKEEGGVKTVYYKYRPQSETVLPPTAWVDAKYSATEHGTGVVKDLFGTSAVFDFPKSIHAVFDCIWIGGAAGKDSVVLDYFGGSGTTAHAVIAMNRAYGGQRKYILADQGEYFDKVIKGRVQKVVYSQDWKDGKPSAPATGISHCFKVLKLESYEDTLNNLQLHRETRQHQTLGLLNQQATEDYLLHYMLDVESRGSLLSVEDFKKPFDYEMNIATDSAGAYEQRKVDLVETFNYLIGLRVKHIDAQPERGFVTVTGTLPSGESCLVLWRDCELLDYDGVSGLCDKLAINPADNEFDVVYINGDHNIPTVLTQSAEDGGATRVLKLRQIESEFLERMFAMEDV
ncbi:DNA methylase [Marinobacterium aestuarii]|uniref:DNA methylase n=1 Tax=Marinobacterium aestuarii TaxID=1821621 RepID=A0A1A9EWT8_9GAMM|nr:DNA methyltransferase [Marinobacterium aestuarii]ANG62604.1 DNA methylase [Marinobacterium aestuarii]